MSKQDYQQLQYFFFIYLKKFEDLLLHNHLKDELCIIYLKLQKTTIPKGQ